MLHDAGEAVHSPGTSSTDVPKWILKHIQTLLLIFVP